MSDCGKEHGEGTQSLVGEFGSITNIENYTTGKWSGWLKVEVGQGEKIEL